MAAKTMFWYCAIMLIYVDTVKMQYLQNAS